MIEIHFSTEEIEALRQERFHHPDPRVQLKMEVLYLKSQGVSRSDILRICVIAPATYHRYLQEYVQGRIERLKQVGGQRPHSPLWDHRETLEAYFRQHPPATVAEAAAKIEELTGLRRKPTQVRQFLRSLGMKPMKVGQIPAKADVQAQEQFKTEHLEPRLAEAAAGQRVVFFLDAAHFVFAPFLGIVWCFQRLFVKAPSGRQRLNVLAALNATTKELFTVHNLTYITAQTVCELLRILAGAHPGVPLTVFLDNARYQRCALVQRLAHDLGIELIFLPPYSPNLNLIERFWKFVKKQCLYSTYYPEADAFQQAILECIAQAPTRHKQALDQLLTWKFQTFTQVPVIGQGATVSHFPLAPPGQKKVSSQAA